MYPAILFAQKESKKDLEEKKKKLQQELPP